MRLVVSAPAGSSVDIVARLVADKLGGELGQRDRGYKVEPMR